MIRTVGLIIISKMNCWFTYLTVGGASFADMGEAIDELVLEAVPLTATESLPSKNQKELVLSCCWLTIKVCFHLQLLRLGY